MTDLDPLDQDRSLTSLRVDSDRPSMTYRDPLDRDGSPTSLRVDSDRPSMAPFWLTAAVVVTLIAMLSPRAREAQEVTGVSVEAIAPGPIPSTERRPKPAPAQIEERI